MLRPTRLTAQRTRRRSAFAAAWGDTVTSRMGTMRHVVAVVTVRIAASAAALH